MADIIIRQSRASTSGNGHDPITDFVDLLDGTTSFAHESPTTVGEPPAWPEHENERGDLYLARRLVRLYGHDLRHVEGRGWLRWDGRRWQPDSKYPVNCAKQSAIKLLDEAGPVMAEAEKALAAMKAAMTLGDTEAVATLKERRDDLLKQAEAKIKQSTLAQSRSKIDAAVSLAESEDAVSARFEDFDADPWLLNCENGTLDLRTGELQPHSRADLLTTLAPVAYDRNAKAPLWDAFLRRVMADDDDLIGYLQRAAGYSLTGDVSEQVLLFAYGSGANGKSVFLRTLMAVLGPDYSKQAAPDLLTVGFGERHPTEIADLRGARMVATIEVAEGKRMAEALVKQVTGGDRLKGRLMRQDFFEFDPTFKIWMAANHAPVIRGTDYAIWRRIRRIPFTVTIPEDERDPHLLDRLRDELPGILAWAVRGCLDWQRRGLGIPDAVRASTDDYRAESDTLATFFAERIELGANLQEQAGALYGAYKAWYEQAGLPERDRLTQIAFGRQLVERGFDKYEGPNQRTFYVGLAVRKA